VEAVEDAAIENTYKTRFEQAMDDDFNTPVALSVLFDLTRELNTAKKENKIEKIGELASSLKFLGGLLGILQDDPDTFLKAGGDAVLGEDEIEQQIQARLDAKKAKDWALADKIRNDLKEQGVILEDSPDGTTSWRRE
jgi:cysteinyl-tRNA synthetase